MQLVKSVLLAKYLHHSVVVCAPSVVLIFSSWPIAFLQPFCRVLSLALVVVSAVFSRYVAVLEHRHGPQVCEHARYVTH